MSEQVDIDKDALLKNMAVVLEPEMTLFKLVQYLTGIADERERVTTLLQCFTFIAELIQPQSQFCFIMDTQKDVALKYSNGVTLKSLVHFLEVFEALSDKITNKTEETISNGH